VQEKSPKASEGDLGRLYDADGKKTKTSSFLVLFSHKGHFFCGGTSGTPNLAT